MNEMLHIITAAMMIGILISAPMGPVGMLIIQRTLSKGRWPAFFTGIGAAFSDLFYCLLTGFCLSFITDFIDTHQFSLQVIGGVVLAIFGVYLFRKNPTRALKATDVPSNNYWTDVVAGFFITFSNPLILFFIIGLFARFNVFLPDYSLHHYIVAYAMIFAGALLWWYIITTLVNKLRRRFNVRSLWLINRIIGSVLIGMAIFGIFRAVSAEYFHDPIEKVMPSPIPPNHQHPHPHHG